MFGEVFGDILEGFRGKRLKSYKEKTVKIVKFVFLLLLIPFKRPVLGRIFDVESEFEVKNKQIRRPGAKI